MPSILKMLDMLALPRFRRQAVSESAPATDNREERRDRAFAIACASVSFRGAAMDVEQLLGLADEFLEYIQGDDEARIPRPDLLKPGRMPGR